MRKSYYPKTSSSRKAVSASRASAPAMEIRESLTPAPPLNAEAHARFGPSFNHSSSPLVLQTKMTVGPVGDAYEQEADTVAHQVVGQMQSPTVQREPSGDTPYIQRATGLATEETTNEYAKDTKRVYAKGTKKQMPILEFIQSLYTQVSIPLVLQAKCYPPKWDTNSQGGDLGSFLATDWTIHLNVDAFTAEKSKKPLLTADQLSREEVAEITDTLYHESRHAEQYFRIARMMAGKGTEAAEIAKSLGVPAFIATEAAAMPLEKTAETSEEIGEAENWQSILVTYKDYKQKVLSARNHITKNLFQLVVKDGKQVPNPPMSQIETELNVYNEWYMKVFAKTKEEIGKLSTKNATDTDIEKRIDAITADFDNIKTAWADVVEAQNSTNFRIKDKLGAKTKTFIGTLTSAAPTLYQAYLAFSHETDAHAVGGKAKQAFLSG